METANPRSSSTFLSEATIQEIQIELIRRTRFNAFDGPRIADGLLRHRPLWLSVIFDRIGFCDDHRFPATSLIKLRDVPKNFWNADTVYALTRSRADARTLAEAIREEQWPAEISILDEPKEVVNLLGTSFRDEFAVARLWWD
jgi:hypothetical protein